MKKLFWLGSQTIFLLLLGDTLAHAQVYYQNNFETNDIGKAPDDFLVANGDFAVKAEDGNKFIELPGAPVDSFIALFGPALKSEDSVSARIYGTKKGRRFPTFAVGLNGQGGYRLQVSPGKGTLEIYKGDDLMASVNYEWKSGAWTYLKLTVTRKGMTWAVNGEAWTDGAAIPPAPLVHYEEKEEPNAGRASIWGSPLANTPIRFDDLVVRPVVSVPAK